MLKTALRHEILPRLLVLWTKRGAIVGLVFGCAYGTAIPFVGNIAGAVLGLLPGAALGLSTGGTAAALVFHQAGTRWVGDFGVSFFAILPATIGIVFLLLAPVPTEAHPFTGDRPNVVKGMVLGLALAGSILIALEARLVGII